MLEGLLYRAILLLLLLLVVFAILLLLLVLFLILLFIFLLCASRLSTRQSRVDRLPGRKEIALDFCISAIPFPIPYYLAIPQDFHDPQIKRLGSRVSKHTPAARRPSAWAARGPASHSELPKTLRTIPTY